MDVSLVSSRPSDRSPEPQFAYPNKYLSPSCETNCIFSSHECGGLAQFLLKRLNPTISTDHRTKGMMKMRSNMLLFSELLLETVHAFLLIGQAALVVKKGLSVVWFALLDVIVLALLRRIKSQRDRSSKLMYAVFREGVRQKKLFPLSDLSLASQLSNRVIALWIYCAATTLLWILVRKHSHATAATAGCLVLLFSAAIEQMYTCPAKKENLFDLQLQELLGNAITIKSNHYESALSYELARSFFQSFPRDHIPTVANNLTVTALATFLTLFCSGENASVSTSTTVLLLHSVVKLILSHHRILDLSENLAAAQRLDRYLLHSPELKSSAYTKSVAIFLDDAAFAKPNNTAGPTTTNASPPVHSFFSVPIIPTFSRENSTFPLVNTADRAADLKSPLGRALLNLDNDLDRELSPNRRKQQQPATSVLWNLTFKASSGQLNVIHGTAQHQTSLLLALLRQSKLVQGSAIVNAAHVAYAPRDAKLYFAHLSLRQNITMSSNLESSNDAAYSRALDLAGLTCENLPSTSARFTTSQKARIGLARCIYAALASKESHLLLLDNVFCDCDYSEVTARLGKLLRNLVDETGACVFIASQNSHFDFADQILNIDASGRCASVINCQDISRQSDLDAVGEKILNDEIHSVPDDGKPMIEVLRIEDDIDESSYATQDSEDVACAMSIGCIGLNTEELKDRKDIIMEITADEYAFAEDTIQLREFATASAEETEEEDNSITSTKQKPFKKKDIFGLKYVKAIGFLWTLSTLALVAMSLVACGYTLTQLQNLSHAYKNVALSLCLTLCASFATDILRTKAMKCVFDFVVRRIVTAPLCSISPTSTLSHLGRDLHALHEVSVQLIEVPFLLLMTAIVCLLSVPTIVLVSPLFIALVFYGSSGKGLDAEFEDKEVKSRSSIMQIYTTCIENCLFLRAFPATVPWAMSSMAAALETNASCQEKNYHCRERFNFTFDAIRALILSSIHLSRNFGYGPATTSNQGLVAIATLLVLQVGIYKIGREEHNLFIALERVLHVISVEEEQQVESEGSIMRSLNHGEICFEAVSCRYQSNLPAALSSVSCRFPAGRKSAICGRPKCESGMSTLIAAMPRLLELSSGRILIDGTDISGVSLASLSDMIALITTKPIFFQGTVKYNLDPNSVYSSQTCLEVLRSVGLVGATCDNSILNEQIDDAPWPPGLSWQNLFSFARALIKRQRIILIDEDVHIHTATEAHIEHLLRTVFKSCTVVMVAAHRIFAALNAAHVVVLDSGRVVQTGCPSELARDPTGLFAELLRSQQHRLASCGLVAQPKNIVFEKEETRLENQLVA